MDEKEIHRQKIRALLKKRDPALLNFCDAARDRFNAKLVGLSVQTELGLAGAGEFAPKPELKP
jgi:hypothetical protein